MDGYRGDFGDIATGHIALTLDFVLDRYTVTASANDTNRGAVVVDPAPDEDGKYLVATTVTLSAQPQPGWFFDSWSGDLVGANNPIAVSLNSNLNVTANFRPVPVKTLERSPSSFTRFNVGGNWFGLDAPTFKVWHSETGTLDYVITTDVSWLTVSPTNGTSRGDPNTHTIHLGGAGLQRVGVATILITPLADGGQPQSVVVTVRVDPSSLKPQWQQGGLNNITCIRQTADGGFIIGGSGSVTRFNGSGSNIWSRPFGFGALGICIEQTTDGGFILGGPAGGGIWHQDFGIQRLDAGGNELWNRTFGGTNDDELAVLRQTADGGFILAGTSYSGASGNKTSTNFGGGDYWVVRLDRNGKRLWDQSLGGTNQETLKAWEILPSGEIFIAGNSGSYASGNKTNYSGGVWVVRLDTNGNKIAEQIFPGIPENAQIIKFTTDGGLVAARSGFPSGSVIRANAAGDAIWTQGSGAPATVLALEQTPDGGALIYWAEDFCGECAQRIEAIRLSASGEILWRRQLIYGDPSGFTTLLPMPDGSLVFGGRSRDGDRIVSFRPLAPLPDRPRYSPLGFRFFISGESNHLHLTEYSTNLFDWSPLQTNLLRGAETEIFDTQAVNGPQRFYRWHPLP